jgi:hypothetical protein
VSCPSYPPWLDHSNYTWRRVQVMKLPVTQFFPTSCDFISLWSKYSQTPSVWLTWLNISCTKSGIEYEKGFRKKLNSHNFTKIAKDFMTRNS